MGCPGTCIGCGRNAAPGIPRGCSSPGNPLYFRVCISAPLLSASPSAACFWRVCCCASRAHNPKPNSAVPGRGASGRRGTIFKHSMRSSTMKERLIIFDTTMRDGEQSPGASMTKEEKLRIARQLERMRVDVIEAGFPASSNGDFEAVQAVAGVIKDSTVAGLCRANDRDIQRGIDALEKAKSGRIHIFIATSALHMEKKLRMTPEQVLEQATQSVRFARKHRDDIEFSPEDGSRSDPDFLCRVLEAVVMAVRTRGDFFNLATRIDTSQIVPASRLVSQITGFVVQPNKAVVGANAFAHASGIHQDGVLKSRDTYEIMRAEDVGWTANKIVLGKLSGRSAFRQRLKELGIELEGEDAYNKAFQRFKDLADKKADIFDEDLHALVSDGATAAAAEHWQLVRMSQASGTGERPHAKLVLAEAGKEHKADADGDGPVDATFKAIERVAKSGAELLLYSVNAVTQGTESQGEVTVRLAKGGRIVNGVGADTDIIVASAKAYVNALNKLQGTQRINPQE